MRLIFYDRSLIPWFAANGYDLFHKKLRMNKWKMSMKFNNDTSLAS